MEEQEKQNQKEVQEKVQKFNLLDVVATNATIQNSIYLLMRANFEIVEDLLVNTPPDLHNDESYLALLAAKEFADKLKEIERNKN